MWIHAFLLFMFYVFFFSLSLSLVCVCVQNQSLLNFAFFYFLFLHYKLTLSFRFVVVLWLIKKLCSSQKPPERQKARKFLYGHKALIWVNLRTLLKHYMKITFLSFEHNPLSHSDVLRKVCHNIYAPILPKNVNKNSCRIIVAYYFSGNNAIIKMSFLA